MVDCTFTVPGEAHPKRRRPVVCLSIWLALAVSGCGIKTEVKVPVAPKVAAARTATMQEMLATLHAYDSRITSLASPSLKLSLTTGKAESGKLTQYHNAGGYLLLRRPDSILLNILAPIANTSILTLLSVGDQFEVFSPRENKVYVGRNSAREFDLEGNTEMSAFSARPIHIFEAILPQSLGLDRPGIRLTRTEEQDAEAKYYVLTVLQDTGGLELRSLRRLWIERSQMVVAREETFSDAGELAGVYRYSQFAPYGDVLLPGSIRIERPLDGYSLDLQFRSWRINPDLPEDAFTLKLPDKVVRIVLKEKGRSE